MRLVVCKSMIHHPLNLGFNSRLVRLVVSKVIFTRVSFSRFNSRLVRLVDETGAETPDVGKFQFQIGAIGRMKEPKEPSLFSGFNSRLVRLVEMTALSGRSISTVSIPDWCDW